MDWDRVLPWIIAVAMGVIAIFGVFFKKEDLDNRCLAALLLTEPDERHLITDTELQDKCPGAERFDIVR